MVQSLRFTQRPDFNFAIIDGSGEGWAGTTGMAMRDARLQITVIDSSTIRLTAYGDDGYHSADSLATSIVGTWTKVS